MAAVACGNGRGLVGWLRLAPAVDELLEVGGLVGAGLDQLSDRGGGPLGGNQEPHGDAGVMRVIGEVGAALAKVSVCARVIARS